MNDTIAAISTASGVGAISIVRVSGKEAISIVNQIFRGKDLEQVPSHTIHYGHIVEENEVIDEVLVSVMKAPKTYTMEDIVEINTHGGYATTKRVLELVLQKGARLAKQGEFTQRAFLNGRIDLMNVEGIMDVIEADTETRRKLAMNELSGKTSDLIHSLREKVVEILTNIEVNIDFPEYDDIEVLTNEKILPKIEELELDMKKILQESQTGKMIKNGIQTLIIGKPNVGKSSILNELLEEEKAIVTNIPGTTRDIVEGNFVLDGIPLHIIDTAGIRKTEDLVEKIGVQKSLNLIDKSDLILFVLNNNEKITKEEIELLHQIKNKNYLILINKTDLKQNLQIDQFDSNKIVWMSIKNHKGLEELKEKIRKLFELEQIEMKDFTYLSNARSISLLKKSYESLKEVKKGIQKNIPIDMVEIDLRNIWNLLGEIIGETYDEELLDQLFSRFCLGK